MNQEKVWNKISESWREFKTKISPAVENFLKDKKGKVLDVGCGSGRNFLKIDGLEWFGVDFSEKMLEYAKSNADKKGIKIELKKSKSSKLPYENNFFDCVLCVAVLHCIDSADERKNTIEEIYRVLKPNCEALISVWGRKSPRLKTKKKECFISWTIKENSKIKRYTYVYDKNELENLVKETGFEIAKSWEERNINLIIRKIKI